MKLTPEQHRKAAQDLRELAELSTIPEEKQEMLNKAALFEALANWAEKPSRKRDLS